MPGGNTVNGNQPKPQPFYVHDYYDCKEPWTAAYLLCKGRELVGTYINEEGKARWTFSNEDDGSWQLAFAWRNDDAPMVNGREFMFSYRAISRAAAQARAEQGAKANERPNS